MTSQKQDEETKLKSPPIIKKKGPYRRISDRTRFDIVRMKFEENRTMPEIIKETGCQYENVKLVCKIYRREGRIRKFPTYIRRYVNQLREKPETLRNKLATKKFEQIRLTWNRCWEQYEDKQVPMLPSCPLIQPRAAIDY